MQQLLAGSSDGAATASIVIVVAVAVALAVTVGLILAARRQREHPSRSMSESHRRDVEDKAGSRGSGFVIAVIVALSILALLAFVLARAFDLLA